MNDESIPVALGSWFFTLDLDDPTSLKPSEFFDRVRRCLESIQGVEDIAIDLMPSPGEDEPIEMLTTPDPRYGEYVGPHWNFESVSFSLRLSLDTQSELLKPQRVISGREAVYFRVFMAYGWAMPISCVALHDSNLDDDTSQGAVAVYRYLVRETERSPDGIRMRCVPPIFAHADIFLHALGPGSKSNQPFVRIAYSVPVQHRYDFGFDPASINDPVSDFFHEIGSELDLYYQIVHSEGDRLYQWHEINALVSELTKLHRASGPRNIVRRMFGTDRLTNDAIIRLTEFAARDQVTGVDLRRQFRNIYSVGEAFFVQELVEAGLDDRDEYPVEQFSHLVHLFEQRRLTDRDMIVVLASSLLGGAVGAAATLLASG